MEGNKHGNASLVTSRRVAFTRLAAELKAALPATARVSFDLDLPIGARHKLEAFAPLLSLAACRYCKGHLADRTL